MFSRKPKLIDEEVLSGIFNIPLYIKNDIKNSKVIITEKKPIFFSTSRY